MVKTKNNRKSLIALVVMAFMLVASIVMAATGAWFTDADNANGTAVDFGTLNIVDDSVTVARATSETGNLMPGDKLTLDMAYQLEGAAANGGAYVRIKVTGKVGEEDLVLDSEADVDADGWIYLAKVEADAAQSESVTATFDADKYGNDYKEAKVTYAIEIQVIQAKNNGDDAKAAFANYTVDGVKA